MAGIDVMISHSENHHSEFPAGPRDGAAVLKLLLTRLWPIFVASWVMFVLINPVVTMLQASSTPVDMLMSLAWATAFIAAYLRLVLHRPFSRHVTAVEQRLRFVLLAVLTTLVLYVDVTLPTGFFWLFIYVNVAAGALLTSRAAAWFVGAITLLAVGMELSRSEWTQALAVPGIAIWGLSTMMLRRLVFTVEELRLAREELARMAVAEERLRFGRDLHDLLGHSLSVIALKSELAGRLARVQGETAQDEIRDIEQVARRALWEVRQAVTGYRQPTLREELDGACAALRAAGIQARFDVAMDHIPCAMEGALAWVIREAVTNVVRHSKANSCDIRIFRRNDVVRATVIDDGVGITDPVNAESTSSGLAGIAERVSECGGSLTTRSGQSGGFSLHIEMPTGNQMWMPVPPDANLTRARTA